jgi:diguanylate cyclase (GGDEF)-like protein
MAGAEQDARPALSSREALPFFVCAVLGLVVLVLPPSAVAASRLVEAAALLAAIAVAAAVLPWARLPRWTWTIPPLAYLAVLMVLREASGGGTSSGSALAPLVSLPVLWLALHGSPRSLAVAVLGTGLLFAIPLVVVGAPEYPASDWRRAVLWMAVAGLVGPGIQSVVRRLREREERLTTLTRELTEIQRQWERFGEELPDTVVLIVDADLRYRQVSGAGALRLAIGHWLGQTLAETSTPENVAILEPVYRHALEGHPGECEITASTNGAPHQVTVVPFDLHGAPAALVVARDVGLAQRREMEARRSVEELRVLAEHDSLTGLVNRRTFDGILEGHLGACADPAWTGPYGAVLVLDIDHFKRVNDALGHHVGDRLIVSVAELLVTALRDTDVVARLGGDEFAVLLRDADPEVATRVAQRVVDVVRRHTAGVPEITGAVTASVGVRLITDATTSAHDLLVDADTAMYDAKRGGRDRYASAAR